MKQYVMAVCEIKFNALAMNNPVSQIPVGTGKNFTGVVDLLTNQKLTWKTKTIGGDGRVFETKPLCQADDPGLLQEVKQARAALIEQVCVIFTTETFNEE